MSPELKVYEEKMNKTLGICQHSGRPGQPRRSG